MTKQASNKISIAPVIPVGEFTVLLVDGVARAIGIQRPKEQTQIINDREQIDSILLELYLQINEGSITKMEFAMKDGALQPIPNNNSVNMVDRLLQIEARVYLMHLTASEYEEMAKKLQC